MVVKSKLQLQLDDIGFDEETMPQMDTPVRIQVSKILLLQKEKLEEDKFDVVKRVKENETKISEKDKKIEELAA